MEYREETDGKGLRAAIVASRYNDFITGKLVDGARECLIENGVAEMDIDLFWCAGSLEIPALAARVMRHGLKGRLYDAIVCVGCVIRGETDHYQFVASESMRGIAQLALEAEAAIGNAVLTVLDAQQAIERSGERASNKGWEAARAALQMANLFRKLR